MLDLYREIDFSDIISENSALEAHLQASAKEISEKTSEGIKKPFLDTQFSKIAIICNLPKVPRDKLSVLDNLIVGRLLAKFDLTKSVVSQHYDFQDGQNITNGSAIYEFDTAENALKAIEGMNDCVLDKNHTLKFYSVEEFEKIMNISSQYEPPKIVPKSELQKWLLDPEFRDQYYYLTVKGDSFLFVNWFDHLEKKPNNALTIESIKTPEILSVEFSTNGSYLIALNKLGFELYGGDNMEKISTYHHQAVKNIEISPNEKYILSFNGTINEAPNTENYIVWDLRTTERLRSFKAERNEVWGSYQWCYDSSYIARYNEQGEGDPAISVYRLPEMTLIENEEGHKTSIRIPGVQKFSWIENTRFLCCVSHSNPRNKDAPSIPTKVVLIDIPSRKEPKKWKSITWDIVGCEIVSHSLGDWVALILIKRFKKNFSTLIHVADLKKKEIEISDIEIPERYKSFAYDRKSGRFCFVFQDTDNKDLGGHIKYDFHFFYIDYNDMIIKPCGKFQKKGANELQFSNNGTYFSLINKDTQSASQGVLEFGFFKLSNSIYVPEIIKTASMPYMNMASYDPSGRFLITASTETKTYILWNANGEQVFKDTISGNLNQVGWRKRPRNILEKEKEINIEKNLKSYRVRFEEHDDQIINKLKYETKNKRKAMKSNFMNFIDKKRKEWESVKEKVIKLRGFDEDRLTDLVLEEIIESEIVFEEKGNVKSTKK